MVTHDPESAKRMQRTVDLTTLRNAAPAAPVAAGGRA
jgi:ABC-type lipoprotein export system ATPase subunit